MRKMTVSGHIQEILTHVAQNSASKQELQILQSDLIDNALVDEQAIISALLALPDQELSQQLIDFLTKLRTERKDFAEAAIKKSEEILLAIPNLDSAEKNLHASAKLLGINVKNLPTSFKKIVSLLNNICSQRLTLSQEKEKSLAHLCAHAEFLIKFFSKTLGINGSFLISSHLAFLLAKLPSLIQPKKIEDFELPKLFSNFLTMATHKMEKIISDEKNKQGKYTHQNNYARLLYEHHQYFSKLGRPDPKQEAITLWESAFKNGIDIAGCNLGKRYVLNLIPNTKNLPETDRIKIALSYLEPLAKKGNAEANYLIAKLISSKKYPGMSPNTTDLEQVHLGWPYLIKSDPKNSWVREIIGSCFIQCLVPDMKLDTPFSERIKSMTEFFKTLKLPRPSSRFDTYLESLNTEEGQRREAEMAQHPELQKNKEEIIRLQKELDELRKKTSQLEYNLHFPKNSQEAVSQPINPAEEDLEYIGGMEPEEPNLNSLGALAIVKQELQEETEKNAQGKRVPTAPSFFSASKEDKANPDGSSKQLKF